MEELSNRMRKLRSVGAKTNCRTMGCKNKVLVGDGICKDCKLEGKGIKGNKDRRERDSRYNRYKRDKKSSKFYNSTEWRKKREEIIRRDLGWCQSCKRKGYYGVKGNVVHHKKELRTHPELGLDNRNLEVLCHSCHNRIHGYR